MIDREALRREALRVHARYVEEIVEAFGFCPWSAPARRAGHVQARVLTGATANEADTLAELAALLADTSIEIAFLLYPELTLGRVEFQHFAAEVRAACPPAISTAFAIADFHPDAAPDFGSPARMVPFIRRSPDPTLQIVRHSALASARRGSSAGTRFVEANTLLDAALADLAQPNEPPLHVRLAQENVDTIRTRGITTVTAVSDEILSDRDRSYAQCGLPPPPWRAGA
jgi:hypothetical protein